MAGSATGGPSASPAMGNPGSLAAVASSTSCAAAPHGSCFSETPMFCSASLVVVLAPAPTVVGVVGGCSMSAPTPPSNLPGFGETFLKREGLPSSDLSRSRTGVTGCFSDASFLLDAGG